MKKNALLLGLSLLSSTAFANDYNTQIDFDYLTIDTADIIGLKGTYYFDKVSTQNTAWAEAAFMGRNNSASLSYIDLDGDAYMATLGGDYFHNNIFVGIDVTYTDVDWGDSDTTFTGEVGYFFDKNWAVSVSAADEEFSDSLALNTKYIATLSGDSYINVEASYLNQDSDLTVGADYYWTAQSSVGVDLSTEDNYNFGINAQHFFTPAISARVEFISLDYDDAFSIGLTGRF
jgi:hypothetical protein